MRHTQGIYPNSGYKLWKLATSLQFRARKEEDWEEQLVAPDPFHEQLVGFSKLPSKSTGSSLEGLPAGRSKGRLSLKGTNCPPVKTFVFKKTANSSP